MNKHTMLSFRIDPELKKQANRLAKADGGRSFSNWLISLITAEVQESKRGKPEKAPQPPQKNRSLPHSAE